MNRTCDCTERCTRSLTAAELGVPELRRDYTMPDRMKHEMLMSRARYEAWARGDVALCHHRMKEA